ncbi:MAG: phosphoribosylformylglycinamidine synthase [Stagnimonas sp.]|nr:phosphoribosylformylglycinamidine synthase [Stagnimonas sp.]
MTLHILPSATVLSDFRVARLLERLSPQVPGLKGLIVQDFFLVDGEASISDLRRLLGEGPETLPKADGTLYVVPRVGTMSPWSSKATDIAKVCGLAGVKRVELGRAVLLSGVATLPAAALAELHDPMMESVLSEADQLSGVFAVGAARPLRTVDVLGGGVAALEAANKDWGLALSAEEIAYLVDYASKAGKNLSDAELMMFAQVNSEHCRHKIFNAEFTVDGETAALSLFQMIKESYKASPAGVLSAYSDNSSVIEGHQAMRFFPEAPVPVDGKWKSPVYREHAEPVHILMKVETHNHPTGISPHPGAATGAGGEIRDEAATGLGGKPKAGLCGFSVSNLRIPGFTQPWEADLGRPSRMASALQIMLEAPIGAAAYNNEFGRPNLAGYFRSYEALTPDGRNRGFHKPIMIAGGYGNIRAEHVQKKVVVEGAALIVLGGPAMLIGLGGAAGSSMATGASSADLDFASVQRANPELERRCQEVVDACWALGAANPILSIHDVGAGGISNALPELVHADDRGGHFQLRDVLAADPALSPMEIWCNESQERYVLAIAPDSVALLASLCARERCPYAVVGTATAERQLRVQDSQLGNDAVQMPMPVLLGKPPRMKRSAQRAPQRFPALDTARIDPKDAAQRVLRHPSVASKSFLITIGDRTVGGLTVRDQMVGPWQVPVADCAVTVTGYEAITGEAMSMGERPVLALLDAPASGRMAVGEAITNIAAAHITNLSDVRLSANWMAACGQGDEDARLFDTVKAVGAELAPALGIAIPVGKDSLSMKAQWSQDGVAKTQTAPLSLIVSAFAPVADVRRSLTPQLVAEPATALLLIDLGNGRNRLGGSILAQVYQQLGDTAPDLDQPAQLKAAFELVQKLNQQGRVLAYHDRSDGGLFATVVEMALAGRSGVTVQLEALGVDPLAALFNEELGMVLQLRAADVAAVLSEAQAAGLSSTVIGEPTAEDYVRFRHGGRELFADTLEPLHKTWAETSHRMAALRDHPDCAREEFAATGAPHDPGLSVKLSFDPAPKVQAPMLGKRPKVAILREQGVNGHTEMAYAFHAAGFESVDVHMSDVLEGRVQLADFAGFAACGGFSYGDVLGAGQGWARSILFNERARQEFQSFLANPERFALGVCNGCQMMAALQSIVPGAEHWPLFRKNRSQQFEARWGMVELLPSKSLFFAGMEGSRLPIAIAHGEGRPEFRSEADLAALKAQGQVAMRFISNAGAVATHYPANPNGAVEGLTSICNADGRVTILMPHPERTIAGTVGSWWPKANGEKTPWFRMFENARAWVK